MSEGVPPPARVRVTGPARRPPPRTRAGDVEEQTSLGGIYLGSLLRVQLALAARIVGTLALTVGSLPLVFHLAPGLSRVEVAGLPLAWLLLGVVVYPLLVLLGWTFVRRAERNERDFADLMRAAGATYPREDR